MSKVIKMLEYLTNKERKRTHSKQEYSREQWGWYELLVEKL